MTTEAMAQIIHEKAKERGVSFVELQQAVGPESEGDMMWEWKGNLIVWAGMSAQFIEALKKADISVRPTTAFVYLADGQTLQLPLAKRFQAYKTPHWLPMVINPRTEGKKNGLNLIP